LRDQLRSGRLESAFHGNHSAAAVAGDVELAQLGGLAVRGIAGVADLGIDASWAGSGGCGVADGAGGEADNGDSKNGFDHDFWNEVWGFELV